MHSARTLIQRLAAHTVHVQLMQPPLLFTTHLSHLVCSKQIYRAEHTHLPNAVIHKVKGMDVRENRSN